LNKTPKHVSPSDYVAGAAKTKKPSVIILSVLLTVLLIGAAAGIGYVIWQQQQLAKAAKQTQDTPLPVVEQPSDAAGADQTDPQPDLRVDNPIDFPALKLENQDIYAWIYIPGTKVNHPVVQHINDDYYYLTHNRYNQASPEGAIYSQMANNTDFSDPVTILYGHNNINEAQFSTLHYFGNEEFFAANDTFYIYTPGRILTYRIFSAYLYDDRHILNSFDFKKPNVVLDYFAFVAQPDSLLVNARPDTKLTVSDKIVQLSTCMSDPLQANSRFLVNGVLIDDQPTY